MPDLHPIVLLTPPSPEQLPAVVTHDCDVALTAGAGTGKTRTLVARMLQQLAQGTPTRRILAVTFTVKAAREMRNRLRSEIDRYLATPGLEAEERLRWDGVYAELDAARIGTIHSLCTELLRAHPAEADVDPGFAVLDESLALTMRQEAAAEAIAWTADDPVACTLFELFPPQHLLDLMDQLLANRLAAGPLLAGRSWERWGQLAAEQLQAILAMPDIQLPAATILEWAASGRVRRALADGDALAAALDDFAPAWHDLQRALARGEIAAAASALSRLRAAVPGNKGRAAAWGGDDPKPTVAAWRQAYDAAVAPLFKEVDFGLDIKLDELLPQLARVFNVAQASYQGRKDERQGLDFDDLEQRALLLLDHEDVLARWRGEAATILVDEFQDTNGRQRDLIQRLNGGRGRLFIVGDAKQSIYRFRGADVEVFRRERTAVAANGLACALAVSHRAHAPLLAVVNWLLAHCLGEEETPAMPWREPFAPLHAVRTAGALGLPGPYVEFHLAAGAKGDGALDRAAQALAQRLQALIAAAAGKLAFGDIAVLCRGAGAFAAYEDAFTAAGIPYETVAGRGFLERPEIRDLLNALRALADPTDDLALYGLLRSPAIGLPDPVLHRLRVVDGAVQPLWAALCAAADPACRPACALIGQLHGLAGRVTVAELLKHFVDATGYRALLLAAGDARGARNVSKLLVDAQQSAIVSVGEFLDYVGQLRSSGSREGEARGDSAGAVQIMTIHQAKGLEFPVVVIGDAGAEPVNRADLLLDDLFGVMPRPQAAQGLPLVWRLAKARDDQKEAAERLRLLYVATTRARDHLVINGHVGVGKEGKLRLAGWLADLCTATGITQVPVTFDPTGSQVCHVTLALDAAGELLVASAIYGAQAPIAQASPRAPAAVHQSDGSEPLLLAPVAAPAPAGAPGDTPDRVWRVTPTQRQARAPSWVVGKLVHAALAGWRFPDESDFGAWCRAQASGYGLIDAARVEDAVRRTGRLLNNLRRSPLYAEILTAEARYHEVPYTLPADLGQPTGQVDLIFTHAGAWTLVDFKTDAIRDARARAAHLEDGRYHAQLVRYAVAVHTLVGVVPRCLICLLDDEGKASVTEVPLPQSLSSPRPQRGRGEDK